MLRKMVKGGYRRKSNSCSFVLTNKEILKICKTENIDDYSSRVQRNYLVMLYAAITQVQQKDFYLTVMKEKNEVEMLI